MSSIGFQPDGRSAGKTPGGERFTARTVLVVDDNQATRKMLRVPLENDSYQVMEASSGRAALAAAEKNMPGLVLQDLILPDMDGFELLGKLRALTGGEETPILALSGFLSRVDEARTASAGFTALLVKPVEATRLLDTVKTYFPSGSEGWAPGARGRRVLLVDDDLVQLRLARIRLEQFGFEVTAARSAVEALSLARAHPPDVMLADVFMPDLDGYQLCFELRRDERLAQVPVVLSSAWHQTDADKDLAQRVGANAFVLRTPDLKVAADALTSALREGAPVPIEKPSVEVKLEHARTVIRQLERRLAVNEDLTRRCTTQAAQLSLLGGLADALSPRADADATLRDVLGATLDAAGISKGAVFIRDQGGALVVRHTIGFSSSEQLALSTFFEQLDLLQKTVDRQATVAIPSSAVAEGVSKAILAGAVVRSALIVPLVIAHQGAGAFFLAAQRTDVTSEETMAFARAVGGQLAQSLELAAAFARLAASEQRYRSVTEHASDAISILTPEGNILDANRSLEKALGLSRDRMLGLRIGDLAASGQDRDDSGWYRKSLASGRIARPLRRTDGSVIQMEFSNKEVEVAGQRLVVSIGRDVTEQVQAQAQLMDSDRMACVGTLAAGVVHELNKPLSAANSNLEYAEREVAALARKFEPEEFSAMQQLLGGARDAVDRISTIVHDLKLFSLAEEDKRGPVDVHRILESSLRIASSEIGHRARVVKEYQQVPLVQANAVRLGQVFLHLIVNAALAMPEGKAHTNQMRIRTRFQSADRVVVEVADTGSGMPADVVAGLFTGTFTTKPSGVAAGLGLFVCHRIITGFGGEIAVDSVLGRGTVFRVFLPPATPDTTLLGAARTHQLEGVRRGRILVIDDEPVIGAVVRRALSAEHEVVTTHSAKEALQRITAGEQFDIILCDVMMPVMTGIKFYRELSNVSPEQAERIVFVTAGAFTVQARDFLSDIPNARLDKPFELRALRALVSERLRSSR